MQQILPGAVALLALGLMIGIWLTLKVTGFRRRRTGSRDRLRGLKAEKKAVRILRNCGYRILDTNPRFQNRLIVNGQHYDFEITPDLLVTRDDQTYVVEIKSGDGDIAAAAIRRQVLEYVIASGLPCLLVLMPEGEIDLIELP